MNHGKRVKVAEMETEMLEQVALEEETGESVWHEMIEACTETTIMLYIAPPEMPEDESPEVELVIVKQPVDKEYESSEEKYGRSRLGEYEPEQEEEKSIYEKESEKRTSEEEQNENNKEVEEYDN